MGSRREMSGSLSPRSHLPTACGVTPTRMARASWVSFCSLRMLRMFSPIALISLLLPVVCIYYSTENRNMQGVGDPMRDRYFRFSGIMASSAFTSSPENSRGGWPQAGSK